MLLWLELNMVWILTKYFITAGLVVLISEVAKRSDRLGGFIAALPLSDIPDSFLDVF